MKNKGGDRRWLSAKTFSIKRQAWPFAAQLPIQTMECLSMFLWQAFLTHRFRNVLTAQVFGLPLQAYEADRKRTDQIAWRRV
jgi:hypothetical protein